MKSNSFIQTIALILIGTLIAPSVVLVAPQPVYAQGTEAVSVPISSIGTNDIIQTIKSTLSEISTHTSAWANTAMEINQDVLQPIAFVLSGNLLKLMTAGVISFVIGKANGTGIPQFVTDIQKSLQTVSDSQALAFFDQLGRNSKSPWNTSIVSQLKKEYLNKTSLAGFWAQNMDTLARTSPNINGYLAGNWRLGGIGAWFALTTQTQNNPYLLYPTMQSQLGNLIGPGAGGATGARQSQLSYGSGFTSWCGSSDGFLGSLTTTSNSYTATYNDAQAANAAYGAAVDAAAANPNDPALQAAVTSTKATADAMNAMNASAANANPRAAASASTGINPGDPCTNADGTPGSIKTPGSVIVAGLNKALGGQQDNVARMGNIGPQITSILGNIATVLQTVQFASQILGGPGSGGLFGVDQPSSSNSTSRLAQFTPPQTSSAYLGASNSSIYKAAAATPMFGSDMSSRITQYQSAWNTIAAAANAASTSIMSLAATVNDTTYTGYCAVQPSALQTALTTEIRPVLVQAAATVPITTAATAMVQKVQNELNAGIDTTGSVYLADMQTLQTMPPTNSDVANAQQDARVFGAATANPPGSLSVVFTGSSLVDQMNLIGTNAQALKSSCIAAYNASFNNNNNVSY